MGLSAGLSGLAIGLTVLSGICWSFFDASRKELTRHFKPWTLLTAITMGQSICYIALLLWESPQWPTSAYWQVGLIAIVLNVGANVFFLQSVKRAPLSVTVPMLSFSPVFASLGGMLFLNEVLLKGQWIGIGLIVLATCLFAMVSNDKKKSEAQNNPETQEQQQEQQRDMWIGMSLMLVVAFLFALIPITDKLCLQHTSNVVHGLVQCLTLGSLFALLSNRFEAPIDTIAEHIKKNPTWLLVAVAASVVAILAQFAAIQVMSVGLFEALKRSVGLFCAMGLGYWMFNEPITLRKGIATAVMCVGIAFVLNLLSI